MLMMANLVIVCTSSNMIFSIIAMIDMLLLGSGGIYLTSSSSDRSLFLILAKYSGGFHKNTCQSSFPHWGPKLGIEVKINR